MRRFSLVSVGVALFVVGMLTCSTAKADILTVSYTVSGSSNNWSLDFTVTNTIDQNLYYFGAVLPTPDVTGSPTGWFSTFPFGAYNNIWLTGTTNSILPADSLSGFVAGVNTSVAPTIVSWIAYTCDSTFTADPACGGSPYTGGGNILTVDNAGFEGTASAVPEPSTLFLVTSGFAAMGILALRRRHLQREGPSAVDAWRAGSPKR